MVEAASHAPDAANDGDAGAAKLVREQSTVQFPYADLDEALSIARVIRDHGGGHAMSKDQIAPCLNQKAASGAFITKLSAARMFGFVEPAQQGKWKATDLGYEALDKDEGRQRAAKAKAFMNVELYRKTYDAFRGRQLPSRPHGLENAFVGFGVAAKQKTNARYAFDRSAKQAGFFEHGNEQLIEPVVGHASVKSEEPIQTQEQAASEARPAPKLETPLDPVIAALIQKLPQNGPWGRTERDAWLQMMDMAFDMAYGRAPKPITLASEEAL